MGAHAHAIAIEFDPFRLKTQALFKAVLAGQQDAAARSEHAVPRKSSARVVERPDYLTRRAFVSGRSRNVPVSGHFPFRNAGDCPPQFLKHEIIMIYGKCAALFLKNIQRLLNTLGSARGEGS